MRNGTQASHDWKVDCPGVLTLGREWGKLGSRVGLASCPTWAHWSTWGKTVGKEESEAKGIMRPLALSVNNVIRLRDLVIFNLFSF